MTSPWIKKIIDTNGQPWTIAIKDDIIRFYDGRHQHTELGQYVSSYYIDTILESNSGLNLDGNVSSWKISASGMNEVRNWLKEVFINE